MQPGRVFEHRVQANLRVARKLADRYRSQHFDGYAEACLALVIAARRYPPDGLKFDAYAYSAMRFRLFSLLRSQRNAPIVIDWQEADSGELGDVEPNYGALIAALRVADTSPARAERREFIRLLLQSLTKPEKRLLLLLLRGHTQRRIGAMLGVDQATVSRRTAKLRVTVSEAMGRYNGSR